MKLARSAALAVLLPLLAVSPAFAAPTTTAPKDKGSLDEQIKAARDQVDGASAEEARLLRQIEASATRRKELDAAVGALDAQVRAVQVEVSAAESRLAAVEARQAETQARLDEAQAQLSEAKARLGRQAIAAYTGQTEAVRFIDATLKSHDIGELVAKREYIKAVAGSQRETIVLHEKLRNEVDDLRQELGQSRARAETQRDEVAIKRGVLQAQRATQEATQAKVAAEVSEGTQLRTEVLARKKEFQASADALQRESDMIAATLRSRPSTPSGGDGSPSGRTAGTGAPVAPSGGRLSAPIPGAPILSGFGPRVHPIYGDVRVHTGLDYAASMGTPIRAAGDGVVISSGEQGAYGIATLIDHGGGLATLYAHQS
ncbi:MAG: peptidoglycan DD-metalloendopeptidase family protein, partial [Candidatus Dormibacteraeota bacterium]|nr:peptidoglycan DD-metalloendopeptidase family protein [Candidatus Dormibacteraeota bacterium]MDQ6910103.1 peptidoglycan DD-metalloendopeptidase family protein [Actinomycetota bacterium]